VRDVQQVAFFPWRNNSLGPWQSLLTGLQQPDGPDGALYVTDDLAAPSTG
jgi:hypothetical protein